MLQIRKEQMELFDAVMLEQFIEKMERELHHLFSDMSADEIGKQIISGIRIAATYGITSEQAVALYITLMCGMGADFPQQESNEWIASTLKSDELNQQAKMDLIFARLES
ncbi:MAG: hypothetical protein L3J28_04585 [Candidatus Polarisedimenticolaceae bacterium]|nr:hypothetical protein [Candidatus Polarisedimenticolaceae bacterium]